MKPEALLTHSLRANPWAERATRIMAAALDAVDPAKAIERYLHRDRQLLTIDKQDYRMDQFEQVIIIGFGKASLPMAEATSQILGPHLHSGIVITKGGMENQKNYNKKIKIIEGAHPIPDERSITGAQQITAQLSNTTEKDLVIFLISGGGSALLTLPSEGISLDDIQKLTQLLLGCGATINEINCLRKHLSQVKGGQLARWAAPAQVVTLILSDVVGDPLDVIASGPTVPDSTTYQDALEILQKYSLEKEAPVNIRVHLLHGIGGKIAETPKVGDPIFENVKNTVVGNNYQAAQAALQQADKEGFNRLLLTTSLQGEARAVGQMLASIVRQVVLTGEPIPRPACIIAGGETTVTLRGNGFGGRNQEVALAAVTELSGLPDVMLIALATDGDDGPTDAAGAVVTGQTLERAQRHGLHPLEFLNRNDAYHFFDPLGDLLQPGLTQTNVNDLTFLLVPKV